MATYIDGPSGNVNTAQDCTLYELNVWGGYPTYGAMILRSGAGAMGKPLLRFDLSAIAAGSTCTAATLDLYSTGDGPDTTVTATVYSVSSANSVWTEAEACWGEPNATDSWAGSAGCSSPTTDYETSALGTFSSHGSTANEKFSISLDTTRIAGWFGATNTNYGLIIVVTSGDTGGIHYLTSSDAANAYSPKLTVTYTEGSDLTRSVAETVTTISDSVDPEMRQYAYPIADVTREFWTDEADGTTDLYTHIDEPGTPNDTDYIKSRAAPVDDLYVASLTSLGTPETGDVILSVRVRWI